MNKKTITLISALLILGIALISCKDSNKETNKVEVERQQYDLLIYVRKALNNFDINLSITVNEALEKQYAYTALEKFEKLKGKLVSSLPFRFNTSRLLSSVKDSGKVDSKLPRNSSLFNKVN